MYGIKYVHMIWKRQSEINVQTDVPFPGPAPLHARCEFRVYSQQPSRLLRLFPPTIAVTTVAHMPGLQVAVQP